MPLPPEFSFSQNNLQDFLDCPRRFELRYLLRQDWPAVRSEPAIEHERHLLRGERFHHMLHQHHLGLPADEIGVQANDDQLANWWSGYLSAKPEPLPDQRYPEFSLRAPFAGYQLVAKYDLLAIQSRQKAVIVDWKTGQRKPPRALLRSRVQTRLYPFLVIEGAAYLNQGQAFAPEQVEMIYWFTADPQNPEHFQYSSENYLSDRQFLIDLIAQVEACSRSFFPLTAEERTCRYCNYRSLCLRGETAWEGELEESEAQDPFAFDLDFDQIAEIEF